MGTWYLSLGDERTRRVGALPQYKAAGQNGDSRVGNHRNHATERESQRIRWFPPPLLVLAPFVCCFFVLPPHLRMVLFHHVFFLCVPMMMRSCIAWRLFGKREIKNEGRRKPGFYFGTASCTRVGGALIEKEIFCHTGKRLFYFIYELPSPQYSTRYIHNKKFDTCTYRGRLMRVALF